MGAIAKISRNARIFIAITKKKPPTKPIRPIIRRNKVFIEQWGEENFLDLSRMFEQLQKNRKRLEDGNIGSTHLRKTLDAEEIVLFKNLISILKLKGLRAGKKGEALSERNKQHNLVAIGFVEKRLAELIKLHQPEKK